MDCRARIWSGQSGSRFCALNFDRMLPKTPVYVRLKYWLRFFMGPMITSGSWARERLRLGEIHDVYGQLWILPCFSDSNPPLPLSHTLHLVIKVIVFLPFCHCTWFCVIITFLTTLSLWVWVFTLFYFHILSQGQSSSFKQQAGVERWSPVVPDNRLLPTVTSQRCPIQDFLLLAETHS